MSAEMGGENAGFRENSWLLRVVNFDNLTYRDIIVPPSLIALANHRKPISCCIGCILSLASLSTAQTVSVHGETRDINADASNRADLPLCVFASRRAASKISRATGHTEETPGAADGLTPGGHTSPSHFRNTAGSPSGATASFARDYTVVYGGRVIYCGSGMPQEPATDSSIHNRVQPLSTNALSRSRKVPRSRLEVEQLPQAEQQVCSAVPSRQSWRKRVGASTSHPSCAQILSQDRSAESEAPSAAQSEFTQYGTRCKDGSTETRLSSRSGCGVSHISESGSTRAQVWGFSRDYRDSVQDEGELISGITGGRTKSGVACTPSHVSAYPVRHIKFPLETRGKRAESSRVRAGAVDSSTGRVVTLYVGATDYSNSGEHTNFLAGVVHRLQTLKRQQQVIVERLRSKAEARDGDTSCLVRGGASAVAALYPKRIHSADGKQPDAPDLLSCEDQTRFVCQARAAALAWMVSTYSDLIHAFFACLLPSVANDAVSILPRTSTKSLRLSRDAPRNKREESCAPVDATGAATQPVFHDSAGSVTSPVDARRNENVPSAGFLPPILTGTSWMSHRVTTAEVASSTRRPFWYSHSGCGDAQSEVGEPLKATLLFLNRGEGVVDCSRGTIPSHSSLRLPVALEFAPVRRPHRLVLPPSRRPARTCWQPVAKALGQLASASRQGHQLSIKLPVECGTSQECNSDYAVCYQRFQKGCSYFPDRPPSLFSLCVDSWSRMLIAVLPQVFEFLRSAMNGQLLCSLIDWSRLQRPPRVVLTFLLVASSSEHSALQVDPHGAYLPQPRTSSWEGNLAATLSAIDNSSGLYWSWEAAQRECQASQEEAARNSAGSSTRKNWSLPLDDVLPFRQRFPFIDMLLHRVYDVEHLFPSLPYLSAEVLMAVFCSRTINRIDTEQRMVSLFKSWQQIQTFKRRVCQSRRQCGSSSASRLRWPASGYDTKGTPSRVYIRGQAALMEADSQLPDTPSMNCLPGKRTGMFKTARSHASRFDGSEQSSGMTVPLEKNARAWRSLPDVCLPLERSGWLSNVPGKSPLPLPSCPGSDGDSGSRTTRQRMRSEAAPWLHLFSCDRPMAAPWSPAEDGAFFLPRRLALSRPCKAATTCQNTDSCLIDNRLGLVCEQEMHCDPGGEKARDSLASEGTGLDELLRPRMLLGARHLRRGPRYPASNTVSTPAGSRFVYSPEAPLSTYFNAGEILVWLHKRWRLVFIRRKRVLPKDGSKGGVKQVTGDNTAADCRDGCSFTLSGPSHEDYNAAEAPSHAQAAVGRRAFTDEMSLPSDVREPSGDGFVSESTHGTTESVAADSTQSQASRLAPTLRASSGFPAVGGNGTRDAAVSLPCGNTRRAARVRECPQRPERQHTPSPQGDASNESTATGEPNSLGENEHSRDWGCSPHARRAPSVQGDCLERPGRWAGSNTDETSRSGMHRSESPVSLGDLSHISLSDLPDPLPPSAERHGGAPVPKPSKQRRFVNRLVYASDARWLEVLSKGPQHCRPEQQVRSLLLFPSHQRLRRSSKQVYVHGCTTAERNEATQMARLSGCKHVIPRQ
ncbi:conserved hypothetical protein [Neospora caninum Liverpool]|uniref:Uncharacterized protein n=1 Tax=Neospora caninum (strain Liverpool) TaxID=572307 RepID=F0VBN7_NEOCL|nr:conserved hypothetical protein [Neospora caninum Liverpool]CBZ51021.1 conserved hypothetical protein [Neospora caninum Liverpool]CEL68325.1 TPA: hypothetical protein BN1204_040960 [Neospora caninum Liverpool]|eukprot:XP_003881054.1 conserved hypothetical protein [Neospora caninum Liverpool]